DAALRRLGRATLALSLSRLQVLGFFLAFAGSFVIAGFAVYAFAEAIHGVGAGDIPTAIGAYSIGFAASVVAFVLPGGPGPRVEPGLPGWRATVDGATAVEGPPRLRGLARGWALRALAGLLGRARVGLRALPAPGPHALRRLRRRPAVQHELLDRPLGHRHA